ncbi:hypothetical protein GPECTOR_56g383 [Gonium pectorale]|uniref:Alpha-helical coiled-coil rod protein n=1 Tax=Gonium pectorale TaxID=33097 RepID=A0A150G615_GONPE|nr:hypothetical protein GPECTOR_56g383 [Gonium pectorale]|eukprot:KXZ45287.1 hypothetical protein GPECTOR_56g383 [Gonium pectorale]
MRADALAAQLRSAEARAREAGQAADRLHQELRDTEARERQLQADLAATQELLLHAQLLATSSSAAGGGAGEGGGGGDAAAERSPGPAGAPGTSGHSSNAAVLSALQQRVAALQQVVRIQERELLRLGAPEATLSPAASPVRTPPGSPGSGDARWENLLRPWREQVTALHEQLARGVVEAEERRLEWGQQLGEMREQFSQARTLLEVLEQRSREQRAENAQLQARGAQLATELQAERQRAAALEQQLAGRDAAAQAVRRQLLTFKAHSEQQMAALESRAEQLGAHATRLSYAASRLTFVLRLAALPPLLSVAVSGVADANAGNASDAPLVAVLRQELAKMGRDREVLLRQLAQVQAAAAAYDSQAAQVRQQVQEAVAAAEELCRRTEAAAGVRLARLTVRVHDLVKQVDQLRAAQRRASAHRRSLEDERDRLRRSLEHAREAETELARQLTSRADDMHSQVAELKARHEEALAVERRRAAEAERLSSKAAAECSALERQLAKMREVRSQQEDARLRRLQTQLHEQEVQLRGLRRERNALLATLRKEGGSGSPPEPADSRPMGGVQMGSATMAAGKAGLRAPRPRLTVAAAAVVTDAKKVVAVLGTVPGPGGD